jgi:hypothetical protein
VQPGADLLDDVERDPRRDAPLGEDLAQIGSLDVLHHHGPASVDAHEPVHRDDRAVADQPEHARLVAKAHRDLRGVLHAGVEQLERDGADEAVGSGELGPIDRSEPAFAEDLAHGVVPDLFTSHERLAVSH